MSVQGCSLEQLTALKLGFNTSYVSVQEFGMGQMLAIKLVSIHPMCRFKDSFGNGAREAKRVSIHPMCRFKAAQNLDTGGSS